VRARRSIALHKSSLPAGLVFAAPGPSVNAQVRDALGLDKCHFALTGAAPIAKETVEFFGSLGINVCEVFGTRASVVLLCCRHQIFSGRYE
jgi:long-subunit acyl-CoA synthetase (AMP-forming)